jgi:hypothetical protein
MTPPRRASNQAFGISRTSDFKMTVGSRTLGGSVRTLMMKCRLGCTLRVSYPWITRTVSVMSY